MDNRRIVKTRQIKSDRLERKIFDRHKIINEKLCVFQLGTIQLTWQRMLCSLPMKVLSAAVIEIETMIMAL